MSATAGNPITAPELLAHFPPCGTRPVDLAVFRTIPGIAERCPIQPPVGVVDRDAQALADVMPLALMLKGLIPSLGRNCRRTEDWGSSMTAAHPLDLIL